MGWGKCRAQKSGDRTPWAHAPPGRSCPGLQVLESWEGGQKVTGRSQWLPTAVIGSCPLVLPEESVPPLLQNVAPAVRGVQGGGDAPSEGWV